jgi:SAM-dependent methyltransferase
VSHDDVGELLEEQIAYYRARAAEYDATSWETEPAWVALTELIASRLTGGEVLELACGTGQWTAELACHADQLTAVDASPEMLEIAARRVSGKSVRLVTADLFRWRPARHYDVVFFSAWLSHVPPQRFEAFWNLVCDCLAPGGRVLCIDELPAASRHESSVPDAPAPTVQRRLRNGDRYRAVKVFYEPRALEQQLRRLGWATDIQSVGERFFLAEMVRLSAGVASRT